LTLDKLNNPLKLKIYHYQTCQGSKCAASIGRLSAKTDSQSAARRTGRRHRATGEELISPQKKKNSPKNKNKAVTIIRFCQLRIVGWLSDLSALCLLPVRLRRAGQRAAPVGGARSGE
jgi:hypothetical protein